MSLLQPSRHGDKSSQNRQNETCGLKGFPATSEVSEMFKIIDFLVKSHYRLATRPIYFIQRKTVDKGVPHLGEPKAVLHFDSTLAIT